MAPPPSPSPFPPLSLAKRGVLEDTLNKVGTPVRVGSGRLDLAPVSVLQYRFRLLCTRRRDGRRVGWRPQTGTYPSNVDIMNAGTFVLEHGLFQQATSADGDRHTLPKALAYSRSPVLSTDRSHRPLSNSHIKTRTNPLLCTAKGPRVRSISPMMVNCW